MNSNKLLLGVLAGVAVGAVLGILFAPAKGSDTRKKLSEKGDEYTASLKEILDEFRAEMAKKAKPEDNKDMNAAM